VVHTRYATEGASPCEAAALARLKAADAEDLKDKPGAAGKKAHKRLHKTIKSVVGESHTRAQLEGAEQLDEVVVPVGALMLLPTWIKQAIVIALVGGTALSYVLDQLHGLRLTMLDKETREHALAVEKWVKEKAKRDGIKAAKAALLKGNKNNKGKAAHKRLHKTIKSVVGEGVIRDTVQRVKNKLRGAGGRTDAELDAMPKRVFMPANPRAVRQQKLEDSKKPGTTWDTKADEFGQQRIGAKNADGDVRYFRSSERGRAESWARGRTKHKRANFPGDPYAD